MPFDLYLNNASDKCSVIFDFGTAYTKLGFSGETGPRAIVPSSAKISDIDKYIFETDDVDEKKEILISFLYEVYYRKLLVNPKDRKIVIVESVLSPSDRRNIIAKILFDHYEVPSILFAPVHLVSLMSLGLQTGIVIDCGYEECTTIPVFEGYHMMKNWQAKPLGGHHIEQKIKEIIIENGILIDSKNKCIPFNSLDDASTVLTRDILEDIKVRMCVVTTHERSKQWHKWIYNEELKKCGKEAELSSDDCKKPNLVQETIEYFTYNKHYGDICLRIPIEVRELAVESLFYDMEQCGSLISMILDVLIGCPIDCRRELANNLVLVGGTCSLPGFRSRLLAELRDNIKSENTLRKYKQLNGLEFKIHNLPGCPNYGAWLGGAIFGHLDSVGVRSLTREMYLEKGGLLNDWNDFDSIKYTKTSGAGDRIGA